LRGVCLQGPRRSGCHCGNETWFDSLASRSCLPGRTFAASCPDSVRRRDLLLPRFVAFTAGCYRPASRSSFRIGRFMVSPGEWRRGNRYRSRDTRVVRKAEGRVASEPDGLHQDPPWKQSNSTITRTLRIFTGRNRRNNSRRTSRNTTPIRYPSCRANPRGLASSPPPAK